MRCHPFKSGWKRSCWKCTVKRFAVTFILTWIGCYSYYLYYSHYVVKYDYAFVNMNIDAACVIPDLDPFDSSIKQYIYQPQPLQCSQKHEYTYIDNTGILKMNKTAAKSLSKCQYSIIRRAKDPRDSKIYYEDAVEFTDNVNVKSDFFKVTCKNAARQVAYTNIHCHIHNTLPTSQPHHFQDQRKPNVLIIGLDSMSRLNFIRRMPKTYRYLTKNLNSLIFKGFNSVGGYSSINIYPLLMGLPNWDHENKPTDWMPIIWKAFEKNGYVTLYSEDKPSYSTFQNFHQQPTTHFQRPFWLSFQENPIMDGIGLFVADRGISLGNSVLCEGRTPKHMLQINYFKEFVLKYKVPRFGFIWNNLLAHDWLNMVQVSDDDYYSLLQKLETSKQLDNTFLIFMSDHGNRFDWIRHTMHGRVEERMPFLAVKPPLWFKSKHPQAYARLEDNVQKLITPFDVHELLRDILNSNYTDRTPNSDKLPRGLSLFSTIPSSRTCKQAAISEHFCACYGIQEIDKNSDFVKRLANYVITEINRVLLRKESLCFQLKLKTVKTAYKTFSEYSSSGNSFIVSIETSPGGAIFEATVKQIAEELHLGGDISRINKYGDQSKCITTPSRDLHKFCYCKNNIKTQ